MVLIRLKFLSFFLIVERTDGVFKAVLMRCERSEIGLEGG